MEKQNKRLPWSALGFFAAFVLWTVWSAGRTCGRIGSKSGKENSNAYQPVFPARRRQGRHCPYARARGIPGRSTRLPCAFRELRIPQTRYTGCRSTVSCACIRSTSATPFTAACRSRRPRTSCWQRLKAVAWVCRMRTRQRLTERLPVGCLKRRAIMRFSGKRRAITALYLARDGPGRLPRRAAGRSGGIYRQHSQGLRVPELDGLSDLRPVRYGRLGLARRHDQLHRAGV